MKTIILLTLILVFAFIQLNWNYYFNINFTPQLLFILAVFFSLFLKEALSFSLVFICGLLLDIFYSGIFGLNIIVYVLLYFYLRKIKSKIYKDSSFASTLIIFGGLLANFIFLSFFSHNFYLKLFIVNSFASALLSLPIFYFLKKLFYFLRIKITYR